jgi:hypothetical protein
VRGPARAVAGGRDGGRLVWGGARGRACPAARRGRYRTKAERADRQRRESPRAQRARLPARATRSHPIPVRGSASETTCATQAHGALRAPLKTLEIFITGSRRSRRSHPPITPTAPAAPAARARIVARIVAHRLSDHTSPDRARSGPPLPVPPCGVSPSPLLPTGPALLVVRHAEAPLDPFHGRGGARLNGLADSVRDSRVAVEESLKGG